MWLLGIGEHVSAVVIVNTHSTLSSNRAPTSETNAMKISQSFSDDCTIDGSEIISVLTLVSILSDLRGLVNTDRLG